MHYGVPEQVSSISLITFIYNEIKALPHYFSRLPPYFDHYLIGVDDRTTDGSKEWLMKYQQRFYQFHFEDFSQIYNEAIAKCHTDWIMVLSPDEVLSGDVRTLIVGDGDCYAFPRNNWYDLEMTKILPSDNKDYQGRLFKNNGKIWWQGRVHEQLCGYDNIVRQDEIIINHFAPYYEKAEPERLQRKIRLYRELGEIGYRIAKEHNLPELSRYI